MLTQPLESPREDILEKISACFAFDSVTWKFVLQSSISLPSILYMMLLLSFDVLISSDIFFPTKRYSIDELSINEGKQQKKIINWMSSIIIEVQHNLTQSWKYSDRLLFAEQ